MINGKWLGDSVKQVSLPLPPIQRNKNRWENGSGAKRVRCVTVDAAAAAAANAGWAKFYFLIEGFSTRETQKNDEMNEDETVMLKQIYTAHIMHTQEK